MSIIRVNLRTNRNGVIRVICGQWLLVVCAVRTYGVSARDRLLEKVSTDYTLVSRKILGSFIEKRVGTHGCNNVAEHSQTLQFG
jgi:hypothetical protein